MQLSDTLEAQLGTWLTRFGEILEKLDERAWANFPAGRRGLPVRALCCLIAVMTLGGCEMMQRIPGWSGRSRVVEPVNIVRRMCTGKATYFRWKSSGWRSADVRDDG